MKTINVPGFTAENATFPTGARYRMVDAFGLQDWPAQIQPAMRNTCEVLSGLLWVAYLEGSYTTAQFFYDAMDGAGCFR